jgi:hypothetical protein
MAFSGKIVLFVEGEFTPRPRGNDPLDQIWRHHLVQMLDLLAIERVVPISKKDIVAMDPTIAKSGVGSIPLDLRISRELARDNFDVAVVAWDIQPAWNTAFRGCRWEETLKLYQGLANSEHLPTVWKSWSTTRYNQLSSRVVPSRRRHPPKLQNGAVLAVCMEPTFESLLLICERSIKDILGVTDGGRIGWPTWSPDHPKPESLLQLAIEAARKVDPKPHSIKIIRGDMENAKNDWGEYFLRQF